jgi:hypothetical protein
MYNRHGLVLTALDPILSVLLILLENFLGFSHGSKSYGIAQTTVMLAMVLAIPALAIWIGDRLWLSKPGWMPNWIAMPLIGGPVMTLTTITASAIAGHLHFNTQWVLASLTLGAFFGLVAGLILRRPARRGVA